MIGKVCIFEDFYYLRRHTLGAIRGEGVCVSETRCPLRGEGLFAALQAVPPGSVVTMPHEELEILGGVLDILHVIHKISNGDGLCLLSVDCHTNGFSTHTGHVPPAMIRSKDSADGMPWLIEEPFD